MKVKAKAMCLSMTKINKEDRVIKNMECPICYNRKTDCKLDCNHSFCYYCISQWYQKFKSSLCPMCRSMTRISPMHYDITITSASPPIDDMENIIRMRETYKEFEFVPKNCSLRNVEPGESPTINFTWRSSNPKNVLRKMTRRQRSKSIPQSI